MGVTLHRRHHFQEAPHVRVGDLPRDRLFERGQVAMDIQRHTAAARGHINHEGPPIRRADLARDQAAIDQAVENARQRRSLVGEPAVELGDRRRRMDRKLREDVRVALREAVLPQVSEVQPDPMRRAMDVRNDGQGAK